MENPGTDPGSLKMGMLNGAVKTPFVFLILSGVVMVITLYTSRKARTVIMTEVNLSRQDDGEERFGSSALSRGIVRVVLGLSEKIDQIIPQWGKDSLARQFKPVSVSKKEKDQPAFDLLRASVNLVVSSALIALGTSQKLPLSTTYVTFMVAMGTSLSDGAWDRESAVFRVTGVFSVIGGWFFTALAAFTVSFLLAMFFFKGGFIAVFAMIALAIFTVYRSHKLHMRREVKSEDTKKELNNLTEDSILDICNRNMVDVIDQVVEEYKATVEGLERADISLLKKIKKNIEKLTQKGKEQKNSVTLVIKQMKVDDSEIGPYYVQSLDYAREIIHSLNFFVTPATNHLANNHKPMGIAQIEELKQMSQQLGDFFRLLSLGISTGDFSNQESISARQQIIINMVDLYRKSEVKRIKVETSSTRNSLLYLNLLQETKNLILFSFNLYKAQRDFLAAGKEIKFRPDE
jgi:Na+/phosphate symporter